MTPQELKNSILQMAIQGKLVEQRAEEGTGEELIQNVSVSDKFEGQRVKAKSITQISDDEVPFDIPTTWTWVKLGTVCTIARGGSPRPIKEYLTDAPDGINWIKIGDTDKSGKYICSTAEKIIPAGASRSRFVHAGDFLLTNSMSFGRPYILKIDGCIHDGWLVISQQHEVFNQDYLYWILSSGFAYSQFCDKVSGAVVKNLNSDKVANSLFPLPPLAEQKRIVAKIESLLPLIDRYEKAWTRLEEFIKRFPGDMQKSLLQMAIQGKLVEQRPEEGTGEELYRQIQQEKARLVREGRIKKEKPLPEIAEDEVPFEVPETWKWVRLRDAAQVIVDCPHSTPKYYDYDTGYYAIGTKCMNGKGEISQLFNTDEETYLKRIERLEPTENDIVYSREGSIVCRAVILPRDKQICLGQRVMLIRGGKHILPEYLQQYLMCEHTVSYLTQGYKGVGVKHINVADVCALPIPLPPLAEQKRIVSRLKELLPLCERLK